MQQAFVDLASQQPSHLLLAELVFCLAEPSPRPTLRPHVQVVDPILSFDGEHLAQTWPIYQHWFRDGHSRGRPFKATVLLPSVHPLPDHPHRCQELTLAPRLDPFQGQRPGEYSQNLQGRSQGSGCQRNQTPDCPHISCETGPQVTPTSADHKFGGPHPPFQVDDSLE